MVDEGREGRSLAAKSFFLINKRKALSKGGIAEVYCLCIVCVLFVCVLCIVCVVFPYG